MLTFVQFVTEYAVNPREDGHWGFIRPRKSPLKVDTKIDKYRQPGELRGTHNSLAQDNGFKNSQDAIDHGLIRYYHRHNIIPGTDKHIRSAGYQFHDTPDARLAIKQHLNQNRSGGGFNNIWLDSHDKKNKSRINSNAFHSLEDANNYLDKS
jgi:hypothetical protein